MSNQKLLDLERDVEMGYILRVLPTATNMTYVFMSDP